MCRPKLRFKLVAALVFVSPYSPALADPVITSVEGAVEDGSELVIYGEGFTAKENPRPLFWWTADGGDKPSDLGRMSDWSGGFDGEDERQQVIVAPGSNYSYRFDHGLHSAGALGRVDYDSNQLYVWRKKYDDFDLDTNFGVRTRVNQLTGSPPSAGLTARGMTSGATGIVTLIKGPNVEGVNGRWEIYYDNSRGSISNGRPLDFLRGESISWAGGNGINDEVAGTYRTFNFKTIRIWPEDGRGNMTPAAAIYSAQYRLNDYRWILEGISGTGKTSIHSHSGHRWTTEEFILTLSSTIGAADGEFSYGMDGEWFENLRVVTQSEQYPNKHRLLFQSQVSNGAQLGSYVYYDALYVDDSLHRVMISSSPVWTHSSGVEVQLPVGWNDNSIRVKFRIGSLGADHPLYLYIVDATGQANAAGYLLSCNECPAAPGTLVVE